MMRQSPTLDGHYRRAGFARLVTRIDPPMAPLRLCATLLVFMLGLTIGVTVGVVRVGPSTCISGMPE